MDDDDGDASELFTDDFDFNTNARDLLFSSSLAIEKDDYKTIVETTLCRHYCNYSWLWLDNLILVKNKSNAHFQSLDNVVYVFVFGAANLPHYFVYSSETLISGGGNNGYNKISYQVCVTNNVFASLGDIGIVNNIQVIPSDDPHEIILNLNVFIVKI